MRYWLAKFIILYTNKLSYNWIVLVDEFWYTRESHWDTKDTHTGRNRIQTSYDIMLVICRGSNSFPFLLFKWWPVTGYSLEMCARFVRHVCRFICTISTMLIQHHSFYYRNENNDHTQHHVIRLWILLMHSTEHASLRKCKQ